MKYIFKFELGDTIKINQSVEITDDSTDEQISRYLESWLIDKIGSFAWGEKSRIKTNLNRGK